MVHAHEMPQADPSTETPTPATATNATCSPMQEMGYGAAK